LKQLILSTENSEIIKKYIKVGKRQLNFSSDDLEQLILVTKDEKFIKDCINQSEELGIDEEGTTKLKILYEENFIQNIIKEKTELKINLPSSMTIGMEIESIGKNTDFLIKTQKLILGNWKCKDDISLQSDIQYEKGIEVISPILTGINEKTTEEIERICTVLNKLGNYTNETCGGHIHIGADYLTNVDSWKNLLDLWANSEKILYIIGNKEGRIPRDGAIKYAGPISKELKEEMDSGSINLQEEKDVENFKKQILDFQKDRYKGINFKNLEIGEKNTVEFRLPNGTVDANTWIQNINLFGGIIKTAQELSVIQEKEVDELNEEEKKKLECFENIKSEDLDEKEKLEALLKLVIDEPDREIYRQRYRTNYKLIKENSYVQAELESQISDKPVKISKNKIGKKVFTGEDRITGLDEEVTEKIIHREIEKQNIKREK